MRYWSIVAASVCLAATLLLGSSSLAADFDKCLFEKNRPAIAFITYTWGQSPADITTGTGSVITPDGYILTARHVLEKDPEVTTPIQNESVTVSLGSNVGPRIPASIVYRDPDHDVALIKVDLGPGVTFATVAVGDSSGMGPGSSVIALGFPLSDISLTPLSEITASTPET